MNVNTIHVCYVVKLATLSSRDDAIKDEAIPASSSSSNTFSLSGVYGSSLSKRKKIGLLFMKVTVRNATLTGDLGSSLLLNAQEHAYCQHRRTLGPKSKAYNTPQSRFSGIAPEHQPRKLAFVRARIGSLSDAFLLWRLDIKAWCTHRARVDSPRSAAAGEAQGEW